MLPSRLAQWEKIQIGFDLLVGAMRHRKLKHKVYYPSNHTDVTGDDMDHELDEARIDAIITLRALVGFLGEKSQFGWWDTNFMSGIGLKYLQIIFPRTLFSAGVLSVGEAARRLHDSRIGKAKVYHLFRLPELAEMRIHKRLVEFEAFAVLPFLQSKDIALKELQTIADGSGANSDGPVHIGKIEDCLRLSDLKIMAGSYAQAFAHGKKVFPYFVES